MFREDYDAIVDPLVDAATRQAEKTGAKIIYVRLPDGLPCTGTGLRSKHDKVVLPPPPPVVATSEEPATPEAPEEPPAPTLCRKCEKPFENWRTTPGKPPVVCEACFSAPVENKGGRAGVCDHCKTPFVHTKKGAMPKRCEVCRANDVSAAKTGREGTCEKCEQPFTHAKKGAMPKCCDRCRGIGDEGVEAYCGGCKQTFRTTAKKVPSRCPTCQTKS